MLRKMATNDYIMKFSTIIKFNLLQPIVKLTKAFITQNILPHLKKYPNGRSIEYPLWRIVKAILYRVKTGCQWRELPIYFFLDSFKASYNHVYYHYRKWVEDGSWRRLWYILQFGNRHLLDLSSIQLDGSHTRTHTGGEQIGYQKRKKARTTNALFITDKNGLPIAMSKPIAGNHHDIFCIEARFEELLSDIHSLGLSPDGLFMNADSAFDAKVLRLLCFVAGIFDNIDFNVRNGADTERESMLIEELYSERFVVERTNAWIDGFKNLLVRYEKLVRTWWANHHITFACILMRHPEFKTVHI